MGDVVGERLKFGERLLVLVAHRVEGVLEQDELTALVGGLDAGGPVAGLDAVCSVGNILERANEPPREPVCGPAAEQERKQKRAAERDGEEEQIVFVGRYVTAHGKLETVRQGRGHDA